MNTESLTKLFYLADKYNVTEMKEAVIDTLGDNSSPEDDDMLAVEVAYLGYNNSMFPDLSQALYRTSVKILKNKFNSSDEDEVRIFFDQSR